MTSTTETETKVETQAPNKEEVLPASDNVDAVKEQGDKPADQNSAPASPTKKTGTLKNVVTVHKKDFENDIVYLYQFVRTPTLPSLSSCCLKIETWLRLNGIPYENIDHHLRYKSTKKGQLPFIELNGKEIEDTENIIRQLSIHFNKNLDEGLTEEQETVSHAFLSMLDNHTGWIVRWWRYNNPQEFIDTAKLDIKRSFNSRFPNSILNFVFKIGFRKHLKDAVGYGLGRFTLDEITELAKNDLKALSKLLGSKDYFFGKEPRLLDITAFAHLAQFLYVPFAGIKEWLETETPNLIAFVDRLKSKVWSDWDEIVTSLEMNTHLPKKETPAITEANVEDAKKAAEEKKAEKKRLAEEKKKEREEKKKKEKEEKERKKREKEEAEKAAKEKAAAEEAAKKAEAEAAAKENAATAETPAVETKEAEKQESAPNGADAAKPTEVTASE